jgi:hypothetical protein
MLRIFRRDVEGAVPYEEVGAKKPPVPKNRGLEFTC